MKVFTFNVNGIRAALRKGMDTWLKEADPDILCIQEIKLSETELVEPIFVDLGYHCYWYPAEKRGYSGVAVLTKIKPLQVQKGFGLNQYDSEGRTILAQYEDFNLVSAYFPSGTTGDARQAVKMKFLEDFNQYAQELKSTGKPLIIAGDVNICHTEIDIHNPKANAKTSGFLPEERAWVTEFLDSGFTDTFRHMVKEPHNYSWWSYRAAARSRNLGWRIDYIFVSSEHQEKLKNVKIHSDVVMSDHCPVSAEFNF